MGGFAVACRVGELAMKLSMLECVSKNSSASDASVTILSEELTLREGLGDRDRLLFLRKGDLDRIRSTVFLIRVPMGVLLRLR